MANEIPQLSEEQPILNPVKVNDESSSYDEFAKTLGALAGKAEEKVEEIESDQSQTMYINSVANAEQIKTSAQMLLAENPGNASKITEQTNSALDTLKQSAYVNSKDRSRLNAYISGTSDDIALAATKTEVEQRQRQAALTHYINWPDQLKAYQNALISDHDKAEQLKGAMLASLKGLVATGALTPEQAGSSVKTMTDVVQAAQDLHDAGYGNPTAQDYHTLTSNPLNRGADNTNAPINATTGWLVDYHNNDKTFQGVMSDISNRMMPNPEAFVSLQPAQRQHAIMAIRGVQQADGMINSGASYPEIEAEYKNLNEAHKVLSYQDEAKRNALGVWLQDLNNKNYLSTISNTPVGNAIMKDFNMRDAAIKSMPALDDAAKSKQTQLLLQNKNKMVNEAVAYGQGHHYPTDKIQPIPQADVVNTQSGFVLGNDPSVVLQTLSQYTKSNQAYLANAMKDPNQRMIVLAASLSGNVISNQDKLDFIAANQTGRGYLKKNIEGATNDKSLMSRIAANLAPSLKIVGQTYDFQQAQSLQNSMLDTTLKYAKYLAYKDNNIAASDHALLSAASWKKYVDQASKIYATAFQQKSGTNWVVNPNQLPQPLSNAQLDILADHITNKGYEYLSQGVNGGVFESARNRNPLKMVITPTGDIQAVDGSGRIWATMPFTSNTIPYAEESRKRREAERKKALSIAIDRNMQEQLHVRLPENANTQ